MLVFNFVGIQVALADTAEGTKYAIATVHPLASKAGMDAFAAGGNALDAAVAAALTLGVVDAHNSGLGGGCFIVLRTADGKFHTIDGRETAPGKATRDMFLVAAKKNGKKPTDLSTTGPLAVGTPGALAAYSLAVEKYGKLTLNDTLLPAAAIAERGFQLDANYAAKLKQTTKTFQQSVYARGIFLKPDNTPFLEGELLRQPELAATYRSIAKHGTDWFYRGPHSKKTSYWMKKYGGILSKQDFDAYRAIEREPIVSTYRGYTIVGMPPPSSGGIHVAQILNILESFNLKKLHTEDPAEFTHVVAEAMKLAFADRAHWLGDSDHTNVPRGLFSKEYALTLAKKIDRSKATHIKTHGSPEDTETNFFKRTSSQERHTTHISATDAEGNWVAITATNNTTFGSKMVIPGTGLILNNEMDDFSISPGVPNAFGLIGAEANAIAPGKRPLSSMSPTIVLKDGRPVLTCGAAGGPKIITQVVLTIIRAIDLQQPLEDAIANPRFHHQWVPNRITFEKDTPNSIVQALKKRGHKTFTVKRAGITQGIIQRKANGSMKAVSDPRVSGKALAQ